VVILAGVDAGSTKTRVVLADARGRVLGVGTGGTCNLVVNDPVTARKNLGDAFEAAAHSAKLSLPLDLASVFVGSAGIVTQQDKAACGRMLLSLEQICCRKLELANDIDLVLAGGLGGSEGVALIAGTGSNCVGRRTDGRRWQAGGREWLVDDRGSGFRLGLEAIIAVVRAKDGRDPPTILETPVFEALGIRELEDVIYRLHGRGSAEGLIKKQDVAALTPLVIEAATSGDMTAIGIIDREVAELACMIDAVAVKLDLVAKGFRWTVSGSVGNAPLILNRLRNMVSLRLPSAAFVRQELPPEFGAVLLAAELAGLRPETSFVRHLQSVP